MASQDTSVKLLKKMGPEVMPYPQIGNKLTSAFLQLTGAHTTGISIASDEHPFKVSKEGLKNYLGHFPAGASFKSINHFR